MGRVESTAPRDLDPDWEPNSVVLKVYVTRRYAAAVEQAAAQLRLSKSLLLRESVRRGLPALVNDVSVLRAKGFRPEAHLAGALAGTGRRGVDGEGVVTARWSKVPGDFVEEPEIPAVVLDGD